MRAVTLWSRLITAYSCSYTCNLHRLFSLRLRDWNTGMQQGFEWVACDLPSSEPPLYMTLAKPVKHSSNSHLLHRLNLLPQYKSSHLSLFHGESGTHFNDTFSATFLMVNQYIVRISGHSRLKTKLYLFNLFGAIGQSGLYNKVNGAVTLTVRNRPIHPHLLPQFRLAHRLHQRTRNVHHWHGPQSPHSSHWMGSFHQRVPHGLDVLVVLYY